MIKMRNKKLTQTIIFLSIISLILFCSIAYSAFSSTMNITGIAHARVEANVRITNFKIHETSNATSSYEEFTKNNVSSSLTFTNSGYAIYEVEVTNYGEVPSAITSITGLPSNLNYELIDYKLNDGICDNTGNCHILAKKVFYIKIFGNNTTTDFILNFSFGIFRKFNYSGFTGTYPQGVIDGSSIKIDFSQENPKYVSVEAKKIGNYNYENKILTLTNVKSDVDISAVNNLEFNYNHTASSQTFTTPIDGLYKVELWGAGGGYAMNTGNARQGTPGFGAYTSGYIILEKNTKLYVYVGGQGDDGKLETNGKGGFNGGGNATWDGGDNESAGAGGGATDIRLVNGEWNNFNSLKSRIIVASGGGGNAWNTSAQASSGGGLETDIYGKNLYYTTTEQNFITSTVPNTTQTTGYAFGVGQNGEGIGLDSDGSPGAGGGYYGGKVSIGETRYDTTAGGSSFISGHNGCNAIAESSTESNIVHTNQPIHYSNYKFTDTKMIDGEGYNWTTTKGTEIVGMPTFDGTGTMNGNDGHGYAKITLISPEIEFDINYTNIDGTYQTKVKKDRDLVVDFSPNAPNIILVYKDGVRTKDYTYKNGILTITDVENNYEIKGIQDTYTFEYTESSQTFAIPYTGTYKVELWGAAGGYAMAEGVSPSGISGRGAYTAGNISLQKDEILYVYVGGKGFDGTEGIHGPGGYNGGGNGAWDGVDNESAGSGGGATDIRLVSGEWNNFNSLKSRIMVAAGGGGISWQCQNIPGGGGGITTDITGRKLYVNADYSNSLICTTPNTTQTTGYAFGYGQNGEGTGNSNDGSPGAGGGYYGGKVSLKETVLDVAAGGSSFISGHNGCDAITASSTETNIIHTNQPNHYSGKKFTNTKMIDGEGFSWTTSKINNYIGVPTHDGTSTTTGHLGNGYAKITLIEID